MKKFLPTLLFVSCTQVEPPPVCGDARVDPGEACDDGNLISGDGCSAVCVVEDALPPKIVINEIVTNAALNGPDAIEIVNASTELASLGGLTLQDGGGETFTFSANTLLAPGERLVLLEGEIGSFVFGLGDADSLALLDQNNAIVDFIEWNAGQSPEGGSFGRIPDTTGDFISLPRPTLNEINVFLKVVINEVTSSNNDEIELLNVGDDTFDLAGFSLLDSGLDPIESFTFLPGDSLAPGEFLILIKGTDHLFGLGADDSVSLFDPDGILFDIADWTTDAAATSFCRFPDGTGNFSECSISTFGSPNQL